MDRYIVSYIERERDPVERIKRYCPETELITEAEIKEIEKVHIHG